MDDTRERVILSIFIRRKELNSFIVLIDEMKK